MFQHFKMRILCHDIIRICHNGTIHKLVIIRVFFN